MIHLLNYLGQAKNENLITIGVFCDLAKCFDTISHTILLKKLLKNWYSWLRIRMV